MTIEEAKKIYIKNGCSLFTMAREDADNYILYKKLNIDSTIENKWKKETMEALANCLKEKGDYTIYNRLYDLAIAFHDKERLELMIKSIDKVSVNNAKASLCIAETIMGRKNLSARSGMIFWAYDIGLINEARILIQKVLSLVDVQTDNEEDKLRVSRDQKKIKEIIDYLKLKI